MSAVFVVVALFGVTLLRWQAAAIAIGVFGFPLLLADYLWSSGALRGRPRRLWLTAIVVGAVLGAGWAVLNGLRIARTYGIGFWAGVAGGPHAASLGVPLVALALMAVPAVVVRLMAPRSRDRLLGVIVGVLGATSFGLTAVLVRLSPQLATGPVANRRPIEGLIAEAAIRGVAIPLTSAAIGGIAGLVLWSVRRRDRAEGVTLPRVSGRGPRIPVVVGVAVAVAAMTAVSAAVTPPVTIYACPPECGRPPTGDPVRSSPVFTAARFSVSYPGEETGYSTTPEAAGVRATFEHGDGGTIRLFGEPARGRSAQQVVSDVVHAEHRTATKFYELPSAMVGYQPGYGEIDDDYPVSATGAYRHTRIVTVAAVKDDYALIAMGVGPFHQYGPDFGPGPPSAVDLGVGMDMDAYVNTFRWRDQP